MKYMLSCGFAPRRSPWNLTDSEKIRFFSEQDDFAPSFEFWSVPTVLFSLGTARLFQSYKGLDLIYRNLEIKFPEKDKISIAVLPDFSKAMTVSTLCIVQSLDEISSNIEIKIPDEEKMSIWVLPDFLKAMKVSLANQERNSDSSYNRKRHSHWPEYHEFAA